jgi:hypothetical protein
MNKTDFKVFVCSRESLKKNSIYNVGGFIFHSGLHTIDDIKKALCNVTFEWVMVDYNRKNNQILSSDDKQLDFNTINKYFENQQTTAFF